MWRVVAFMAVVVQICVKFVKCYAGTQRFMYEGVGRSVQ